MHLHEGKLSHGTVALLLFVFTVLLLMATAPDIGLTWDEPEYIDASAFYVRWLGELVTRPAYALGPSVVDFYWKPLHEHPPLDKVWIGLVSLAARPLFDDLTAHRLGNILLSGALVALLYVMVAVSFGRLAGLAAVASLLTMPRFFFHAHLAALDVPVTFAMFAVVFMFWQLRDSSALGWSVLLGLAWGLALATKINAILVPPALFLWMLVFRRRLYLFGRLVVMGVFGILLFILLWPWLYNESISRLIAYLGFMTVRHAGSQWYLGHLYPRPPWHFPFVIILAVVPLSLIILSAFGIARVCKKGQNRPLGWLLVICAVLPLVAQTTGRVAVFDNDRLFMPSFPYLAALAGLGFDWVIHKVRKSAQRVGQLAWAVPFSLVIAGVAFLPQVLVAGSLYPHLLSYYSEAVGGLPGATRLGFETTYWCETYLQALPYLNAHAKPGAIIWVQRDSYLVLRYYQLRGKLRRDLRLAWSDGAHPSLRNSDADYVVLQYRQTGFSPQLMSWLNGREPAYRLSYYGVPLLEVYRREKHRSSALVMVDFGGILRLIHYDIPKEVVAGSPLEFTLYWELLGGMDRMYSVFSHLIDEKWSMCGQSDGLPRFEEGLVESWTEGRVVEDRRMIEVPANIPEGNYRIEIGVYSPETMERLKVKDTEEGHSDDRVLTLPIQVWRP